MTAMLYAAIGLLNGPLTSFVWMRKMQNLHAGHGSVDKSTIE